MLTCEDFLLEIGCEELPAGIQPVLIQALKKGFQVNLLENGLEHGTIHTYVTPRRLAILIEKLQEQMPARKIERKGPLLSLALDAQGAPTAVGLGFAKSCGVDFKALERMTTDKGDCLYYSREESGQRTTDLLPALCEKIIKVLPIAKSMRWGEGDVRFARPVHWIVLLFGKEVLPAHILGQKSDRLTYGHRFHHPQAISIAEPKQYERVLEKAYVIADAEKRRALIVRVSKEIAEMIKGEVLFNEDLLNEVTAIVEWPVPLLGQFDPYFLKIPYEALMLAMQHHQKTFSVQNKEGQLMPYFICVSNIDSRDPNEVVRGNERVINARLSDAKFFFDTDGKHSLAFMAKRLGEIIFYAHLGSLEDKANRIATLAECMADTLDLNREEAKRAGELCKADLVSDMVGEFPELQGIMGGYYAAHHETPAVAKAIAEHYRPRFAKDDLPASALGAVVAIADKLDTLVGIFAAGEIPKGDKDPFGLRRAVLGVLKIILARQWPLNLETLLEKTVDIYKKQAEHPSIALDKAFIQKIESKSLVKQIFDFMMERFRYHYLEEGVSVELFESVLAVKAREPHDFDLRLQAMKAFSQLPQSSALTAANKRVTRILEKEAKTLTEAKVQESLLVEAAEKALWQALEEKKKEVSVLCEVKKYAETLLKLVSLQPFIDDFFDNTMVMVDDEKLRKNRLALLWQLCQLLSAVADLSWL